MNREQLFKWIAVTTLLLGPLSITAQTPPPPPPDFAAIRAALDAFNKMPDSPGTGKYPALKQTVPSLPNHVIYRPANLSKLGDNELGVLAWGNGGCSADGAGGRAHLAEIASHGYLAIANGKILSGPGAPPLPPGAMPLGAPPAGAGAGAGAVPPGAPPAPGAEGAQRSIPPPATQAAGLREAIDWALAENTRKGSAYFGKINPKRIAVSGWSCGGLQALEVAADPRVSAVIIHNSGIFGANATASPIPGITIRKSDLKKLHTPVLYILGGPSDIAYANGMDDFKTIDTVPVMVANIDVGHGGTFLDPNGGRAASVAVSWLDWQLKGDKQAGQRFTGPDCGLCRDPQWKVERKKMETVRNDDSVKLRPIRVDTTKVTGQLRPFNGVHGVPSPEFADPSAHDGNSPAKDLSALYRTAGIDIIRTHDNFGPSDIDPHFGKSTGLGPPVPVERGQLAIFPDMSADVRNAKSYNFAPTDRLIASIRAAGAEPLFRIGRSIGAGAEPPADIDQYAEIVKHIVLHYNKGWANGTQAAVRYWEIWNEPDFKVFWTGSPELFYSLYEKTTLAIKSADPKAQVGGPTIAMPLNAGAFREGFLDYVRAKRLPLDFFSWHFYTLDSNDPNSFVTIANELRSILDARGFQSTRSVLDEWNLDLFDRESSITERAAFAATSLIYMVGAPIDIQAFYRADTNFRGANGAPDTVAQALTQFGTLRNTPVLVSSEGGDNVGFAVLAGRSKDSRTIQILISNYQIPARFMGARAQGDLFKIPNVMDVQLPERRSLQYQDNGGYDLHVQLPTAGAYRVTRYRLAESSAPILVDDKTQKGPTIRLQANLPPPGIEMVTLTRE